MGVRENLIQRRRVTYPTIERRSRHDVIACSCDSADGHELGCLAACSCHGSHPALKRGNPFFKYFLRSSMKVRARRPESRIKDTYYSWISNAGISVSNGA
jgi:hypothetical protein